MTRYIAVDTETTGINLFHESQPFAVTTCDEVGITKIWEWDVDPTTRNVIVPEEDLQELVDYLDGATLVFHNGKFDIHALKKIGVRLSIKDVWSSETYGDHTYEAIIAGYEDTLLASHVCNSEEPHGLKALSEKYLGILSDDEHELLDAVKSARRAGKVEGYNLGERVPCDYWLPKVIDPESTVLSEYAVQDVVRTMLLWIMYQKVLTEKDLWDKYQQRKSLVPITYRMEQYGVTLKPRTLTSEIARYNKMTEEQEIVCHGIADKFLSKEFNVRSGIQIQKVLYGDPDGETSSHRRGLNCPVTVVTKTGASTSASVLLDLYHNHVGNRSKAKSFLGAILSHRKARTCSQYLQSYQDLLLKEGGKFVLHPSYNQTGTRTTRWSCSNPNGQNIGAGGKDAFGNEVDDFCLRDVFGPAKGRVWLAADYSQLELRILSVLAKEEKLLQAFEEGADIHALTASLCDISRKAAKGVNFGLIYGAGRAKLEMMTGKKNFDKIFKEAYPGIGDFMDTTSKHVRKYGFVRTIGGYELQVPDDKPYIGTNYTVQGSAGDILNQAMININGWLKPQDDFPKEEEGHLIMCIHDELVLDFPKGKTQKLAEEIQKLMELAGTELGVTTPVDVDRIDSRWSDKKGMKLDRRKSK